MGYLHIDNLYKFPDLGVFGSKGWALEKIHGTSAHISWKRGDVGLKFFSGGEQYERFKGLFNEPLLLGRLLGKKGFHSVTLFGEAYGGKQQGMSHTYGPELRFVVFDVQFDGKEWLDVLEAAEFATSLGLDFVDFSLIPITVEALNAERDKDSTQAIRNQVGEGKKREGIVLRPLHEKVDHHGSRVIGKHKRDDFQETRTPRPLDGEKQEVLIQANAIAEEWVTPLRLEHVLDKLGNPGDLSCMPLLMKAMVEDVEREGRGEILESKEARKAIGRKTVELFKRKIGGKFVLANEG